MGAGAIILLAADALQGGLSGVFRSQGLLFPPLYVLLWSVMGVRRIGAVPFVMAGVLAAAALAMLAAMLFVLLIFVGIGIPLTGLAPVVLVPLLVVPLLIATPGGTDGARRLRRTHLWGAVIAGVLLMPLWIAVELSSLSFHSEPSQPTVGVSTLSDLAYGLAVLLAFAPHAALSYAALNHARMIGEALGPERPVPRAAALLLVAYLMPASLLIWRAPPPWGPLWPLDWVATKNDARIADRERLERWFRENAP